uniref:Uncharacterized protein n=1 Tax=Arundo donax TaxID=35708 RepID=A0A0A9AI44_ARUDO
MALCYNVLYHVWYCKLYFIFEEQILLCTMCLARSL